MPETNELDLTSETLEVIEITPSTLPRSRTTQPDEIEDLSNEPIEPETIVPLTEPFNQLEFRERARRRIAVFLLWILSGVIAAAFVSVLLHNGCGEQLMKLMTLIFTPIVALVGSAVGFYFGTQSSPKAG